MYIAICEDNAAASEQLKSMIYDWAQSRHIAVNVKCYTSAEHYLCVWPEFTFDLTMLDIQMKHVDGVQLAEIIRRQDPTMMLIFVTGMSQYVLRGYDVDALHYLVKPVTAPMLLPVLDKAHSIYRMRRNNALVVPDAEGCRRLPLDEVLYLTLVSHYVDIQTLNGKYTIRSTAAEIQEKLPPQFMRCHRCYVVNLFKVEHIQNTYLCVSNGDQVPVSRNCVRALRDAFLRFHM